MLLSILDFTIKNYNFTFLLLLVVEVWVWHLVSKYVSDKIATLFFVLVPIITIPVFAFWGLTYKVIREKGAETTYSDMFVSLDFTSGFLFSLTPTILLLIITFYLFAKINNKLFWGNSPDQTGAEIQAFITLGVICIILYGMATFGNCIFFDVYGFGQRTFFYNSYPIIDLVNSDESLFEVSPECNRIFIKDVDIYTSPIKLLDLSLLPINAPTSFDIGNFMTEIINIILKIISPIADILGIYQFIESRRKKKSNGT